MKQMLFVTSLLIMLLTQQCVFAQSADTQDKIQEVEKNLVPDIQIEGEGPRVIAERMTKFNTKGVSIAVIHNYRIEWAKGYGWADDSLRIPVSTKTLFQAASISKSLNAVGVLRLVQKHKIDLYADINTYLINWKFPYDSLSKNKKISVANLLSHTGGLKVHGFGGYQLGKEIPTIEQILDGVKPANSPPIRSMYEPGLKSEYSGGGITISQMIVMDVTHKSYDKYMYKNVLRPLGMKNSTYTQPPVRFSPELLATGYRPGGQQLKGKYHTYPEQAAAGLWTTPTDLAKYIIETQLAYAGRSNKVLNQETTLLRLTPYMDKSAALGVFIEELDSTRYFGHSGANEGFRSQYYGSFEGGNGVVVMVNSDNGDIIPEIINSVAKVYGFKGLYRSKLKTIEKVVDSVLESYTGKYQMDPKTIITITREGGKLYAQPTGSRKVEIFPETQNKFFLKALPIELEFIRDDKGEVNKMMIFENGQHDAKRVK